MSYKQKSPLNSFRDPKRATNNFKPTAFKMPDLSPIVNKKADGGEITDDRKTDDKGGEKKNGILSAENAAMEKINSNKQTIAEKQKPEHIKIRERYAEDKAKEKAAFKQIRKNSRLADKKTTAEEKDRFTRDKIRMQEFKFDKSKAGKESQAQIDNEKSLSDMRGKHNVGGRIETKNENKFDLMNADDSDLKLSGIEEFKKQNEITKLQAAKGGDMRAIRDQRFVNSIDEIGGGFETPTLNQRSKAKQRMDFQGYMNSPLNMQSRSKMEKSGETIRPGSISCGRGSFKIKSPLANKVFNSRAGSSGTGSGTGSGAGSGAGSGVGTTTGTGTGTLASSGVVGTGLATGAGTTTGTGASTNTNKSTPTPPPIGSGSGTSTGSGGSTGMIGYNGSTGAGTGAGTGATGTGGAGTSGNSGMMGNQGGTGYGNPGSGGTHSGGSGTNTDGGNMGIGTAVALGGSGLGYLNSGTGGNITNTSGPGATGSVGSGMGGSGATGSVGYGGGNSSGAGVHLGGGGTPNAGHGSGHGVTTGGPGPGQGTSSGAGTSSGTGTTTTTTGYSNANASGFSNRETQFLNQAMPMFSTMKSMGPNKALQGKQSELPEHLQKAIINSPGMYDNSPLSKNIDFSSLKKGALRDELNIPKGEKIPLSDLKTKPGDSKKTKQRKNLAKTMRKFKS
tara:strand:+ start:150 stop:2174 length:2025 start_codon:yes stop_codon:yes gene_type:complete